MTNRKLRIKCLLYMKAAEDLDLEAENVGIEAALRGPKAEWLSGLISELEAEFHAREVWHPDHTDEARAAMIQPLARLFASS